MGQPWEGAFPQVKAEMNADATKRTRQMSPKQPAFHTFTLNELIILLLAHFPSREQPCHCFFPLSLYLSFVILMTAQTTIPACLQNGCSLGNPSATAVISISTYKLDTNTRRGNKAWKFQGLEPFQLKGKKNGPASPG